MKTNAIKRIQRLQKIENLLLAHPRGLTQAELARNLKVHRSTILRDLPDLPPYIYQEDSRLCLDRQSLLVNVRLSLHEATALHLATRLLVTRMDRQNPHAATALRKLAISIEQMAPRISEHMHHSADEMESDSRRLDPAYIGVLEKLVLAWAEARKLHIWYRRDDQKISEYTFSPYFIEPYAIGQTIYAIGFCDERNEMRTFKVAHIERAELTQQSYVIPNDFNAQTLFADAWGIWYTDKPPVRVVLRFEAAMAQRVQETSWHRSQKITALPDGRLLWEAQIAEPREMVNWIRGWGAAVEVLEPQELREEMQEEIQRLYQRYSIPVEGK
jgi:predicted DNA-binding transcriptional regulator YafY